jgi:hypothetical protein
MHGYCARLGLGITRTKIHTIEAIPITGNNNFATPAGFLNPLNFPVFGQKITNLANIDLIFNFDSLVVNLTCF